MWLKWEPISCHKTLTYKDLDFKIERMILWMDWVTIRLRAAKSRELPLQAILPRELSLKPKPPKHKQVKISLLLYRLLKAWLWAINRVEKNMEDRERTTSPELISSSQQELPTSKLRDTLKRILSRQSFYLKSCLMDLTIWMETTSLLKLTPCRHLSRTDGLPPLTFAISRSTLTFLGEIHSASLSYSKMSRTLQGNSISTLKMMDLPKDFNVLLQEARRAIQPWWTKMNWSNITHSLQLCLALSKGTLLVLHSLASQKLIWMLKKDYRQFRKLMRAFSLLPPSQRNWTLTLLVRSFQVLKISMMKGLWTI